MEKHEKINVCGIICLIVAVIVFLFIFTSALQGNDDVESMAVLLMIVFGLGCVGCVLIDKAKKLKYQFLQEKENQKRNAQIQKSIEISRSSNLSNKQLSLNFKSKYGISFENFKSNLLASDFILLSSDFGANDMFVFRKIKLNNKTCFLLESKSNKSSAEKLIYTSLVTDEIVKMYDYVKLSDIEKHIYDYDLLKYVNFIEDITTVNTGKKPSSLGLAVHESIYGTASAINKANTSVNQMTWNSSNVEFIFDSNFIVSKLKHDLSRSEQSGPTSFKGLLREVWHEKNQELVKNVEQISEVINSVQNNAPTAAPDYGKLRELKALLDEGIITQEEFESQKKKILG